MDADREPVTGYDPTTDAFDTDVTTPYDLFCSGHAFLPDDRLLVAGGTAASEQRSVDLAVDGSTLTVPANHNLTPPGWCRLFVRDAAGVPSVASWVEVG